jgi:hypothetical protein
MKKTIKQFLFLFCILLNVTLFISLVDVIKGMSTDKTLSFATGLPCTNNVIMYLLILLFGTLTATLVLYKDDSFE